MTIHTETHWLTPTNEMYVAIQDNENVYIHYYETPENFAANSIDSEFRLPYEFLEEILRVRKPT